MSPIVKSSEDKTDDEKESLRRKGETLLIIDDEAAFVEITKILMTMAGYNVISALNGQEGVEIFSIHKNQVDIIICDLNMPKLGGHSLIQKLVSLRNNIKILIVSGSTEEIALLKYLKPGMIEFLQKPFTNEVLLKRLRNLLH